MKKRLLQLILALVIFSLPLTFSACGDDDDKQISTEDELLQVKQKLAGEWGNYTEYGLEPVIAFSPDGYGMVYMDGGVGFKYTVSKNNHGEAKYIVNAYYGKTTGEPLLIYSISEKDMYVSFDNGENILRLIKMQ
ncbi:MAG: hypothetical protein IJ748_02520 [Bacteroidales bacterium]|nr:hypothetical protein [Bacteroidales bacterium]